MVEVKNPVKSALLRSALCIAVLILSACASTEELFAEYDDKFCVVPEYPAQSFRWEPAVYFKSDSDELSSQAIDALKVNVATLKRLPAGYKISLKGFADHQASSDYNQALSTNRVNSVRSYLNKTLGLDVALIVGSAHGEDSPLTEITSGPVDVDRRVEMLLMRSDLTPVANQPLIRLTEN